MYTLYHYCCWMPAKDLLRRDERRLLERKG
jgi:hypothetical protein